MGSAALVLVRKLRIVVLCFWPATVLAATQSLGQTFGEITAADWITLVLLSSFSGLVALMQRVRKNLEYRIKISEGEPADQSDRQAISWRVFALAHMTGAIFVGFIAFMLCEAGGFNNYIEAVTISLTGWSGAKVADTWANNLTDNIASRIGAFVGAGNKETKA